MTAASRSLLLALSFMACDPATSDLEGGATDGFDTDADTDADTAADTGAVGPGEPTGLPCEIDAILDAHCRRFHGDPLLGAPMPLVTYADLTGSALGDPSLTVAELSLHRMASVAAPMPPGAPHQVAADDRAAWLAWLDAGAPRGACGTAGDTDGSDTAEPPALQCSSGRYWDADDDDGTPHMFPGRACIDCHDREREDDPDDDDIPDLLAAGTIYPTLLEPDDCLGVDDDAIVVILEGQGGVGRVELTPNASGNFRLHTGDAGDLQPPFLVTIRRGDAVRTMPIPAPHGDCNACHTETGTMGAPGRVLAP